MKTINLSEKEFKIIKSFTERDIEDLANDKDILTFFKEFDLIPKDYIDERISICKQLGFDFWKAIRVNCSDYKFKRLQVIYEGKSLETFNEQYENPREKENVKKEQ